MVFAIALTSCVPTQTLISYSESSARLLEGKSTYVITPIIADLDVSKKKISYEEKEAFSGLIVTRTAVNNIDVYKRIALGNAAKQYDADIIVGAEVDVKTVNQRLVITVSGYPAKYVNFRNATEKDIELVNNANSIQNNNSTIASAPQKVLNVRNVQ